MTKMNLKCKINEDGFYLGFFDSNWMEMAMKMAMKMAMEMEMETTMERGVRWTAVNGGGEAGFHGNAGPLGSGFLELFATKPASVSIDSSRLR